MVPILYGRQANWLPSKDGGYIKNAGAIFVCLIQVTHDLLMISNVVDKTLYLINLIRCSDTKAVYVFMSFVVYINRHTLLYALDNQVRLSNRICYY